MLINIENLDFSGCVDEDSLCRLISSLAQKAQHDIACAAPWHELSVYLLNDQSITGIHRSVYGSAESTDVITQRYEAVPGEPEGLRGDMFLNLQCAQREGTARSGWTPDREVALYIAHACDHLNDYDDADDAGFRTMRKRELDWLSEIEVPSIFLKTRPDIEV
jgi:rRNA maturation RNase YbeY